MKILISPDSYKGSLTAMEVADNIEKGIKKVLPGANVEKIPMADGGEGTVQALVDAHDGVIDQKEVTGPLGNKVQADYGFLPGEKTGVIEMAAASGLTLVANKDPMKATTYGTGELIKEVLNKGAEKIIIGIGGSATVDGGVGAARALGISFRDENGEEIGPGGGELGKIAEINFSRRDPALDNVTIKVACDVTNPLYGKNGAAYVYGPQKGAGEEMVEILDNNLRHLAAVVKEHTGRDMQSIKGAGAAGGLGAGLCVFLDAQLVSGVDLVSEANHLEEHMKFKDVVITGEGRIDGQTVQGKAPIGVARLAKKYNLPVIGIAGCFGKGADKVYDHGIDAIFSLDNEDSSTPEALRSLTENVFRLLMVCKEWKQTENIF
ncbi:MAG: glycerate kinase [Halanaerobiales bacterium]